MKSQLLFLFLLFTAFAQFTKAQTWVKVDAGSEYSMALKSDGTIWSWGYNFNGQLGAGGQTETEPIQIGGDNDWADISVGGLSSFAIKEDGTLWAWGYNYYGQLGLGTTDQAVRQIQQVGTDTNWVQIEGGLIHTIALKKDSSLWSFGSNIAGQLGFPQVTDTLVPARVDTHTYIDIAAGGFHNLAVRSDSTLWGWGDNGGLQVGSQFSENVVGEPSLLDSTKTWMNVECGFQYSAAQKVDSTLYTWGFNGNGQLGHSSNQSAVGIPTLVDSLKKWRFVSAGSSFMHSILSDGTLWAWGFNGLGQLGTGNNSQQSTPIQVSQDTSWKQIADANGLLSGQSVLGLHSLALKGDSRSICVTGANYTGQLGTGTTNPSSTYDCTVGELTTSVLAAPVFQAEINAYPVPADDHINIELLNASSEWTLNLYDTRSALKMQRQLRPGESFRADVSSLPSGLYYAVIMVEGEIVGRKKVVIAR